MTFMMSLQLRFTIQNLDLMCLSADCVETPATSELWLFTHRRDCQCLPSINHVSVPMDEDTKKEKKRMVIDIEFTLNRFGFYKPSKNKIQFAMIRISWWRDMTKNAISFEVNWKN